MTFDRYLLILIFIMVAGSNGNHVSRRDFNTLSKAFVEGCGADLDRADEIKAREK